MIVICPACGTRYSADDSALGGSAGRRVRCASCGNTWHYSPETATRQESVAEVAAASEAEAAPVTGETGRGAPAPPSQSSIPPIRAEPSFETRPRYPSQSAPPSFPPDAGKEAAGRRRRRGWLRGIALIVFALAIVLGAIAGRDRIMQMWPRTAPVYRALGLADPVGAGLEVTVAPTRTADSLKIDGRIANTSETARQVPRLRVALRDGNNVELDSQLVEPPVQTLAPGASANFSTIFEQPSITATGVAVTFAPR